MATQRLTVATITGDAGTAVEAMFQGWRAARPAPDPTAVARFCDRLRANGTALPVIYFCEWVDRWLMGDLVPGPGAVTGRRYEATCLTPSQAVGWADRCGTQFAEQEWLARRLREAAGEGWPPGKLVVVVVREILGASTTDEEVLAAMQGVPDWLTAGAPVVTDPATGGA